VGWSSKRNGELLKLMIAERFEALLTVDQGIEFQQNLREVGVGVVVVCARTNRIKELRSFVPRFSKRCPRSPQASSCGLAVSVELFFS
jgi:hypothetical protein